MKIYAENKWIVYNKASFNEIRLTSVCGQFFLYIWKKSSKNYPFIHMICWLYVALHIEQKQSMSIYKTMSVSSVCNKAKNINSHMIFGPWKLYSSDRCKSQFKRNPSMDRDTIKVTAYWDYEWTFIVFFSRLVSKWKEWGRIFIDENGDDLCYPSKNNILIRGLRFLFWTLQTK